jgi:hypothetical protein
MSVIKSVYCAILKGLGMALKEFITNIFCALFVGGTCPSGQRGALAFRRSQFRIPAVAVNYLYVLI